ncbi:MAG: glutathione S-transferase N-terminal domain-containing protein, partial [Pseudomonadota bacterium]
SLIASILRAGAGRAPAGSPLDKEKLPTLYEFEACPFCRIAREAISEAGLAVRVRPCPKRGTRFRPDVEQLGGKAQFPYLVPSGSAKGQYESQQIAKAIAVAANRPLPFIQWLGPLNTLTSQFAGLARLMSGLTAKSSREPKQALIYFGAERNPSGRLIKERLCSLEMEYIWVPTSHGAPRLHDPNMVRDVLGGRQILKYLAEHYEA